ncbi:outer membrane beta-barrel family protein [Myroides pelagicus]|uniref:outer membrane beta-barrel family protein n=1 Tax=Myroides pelagicus TaxID=270914 RepID=UPI002DBDE15A|nr:outer membrane beta-barrel family protein [Myroides pelagicus]MEC4112781.1 outer membrane beta-barrel family protein [Myroides pelagicus]
MKTLASLISIILLSITNNYAQNSLTGNIQTSNQSPVDFAEIYLLKSNGAIAKQSYTSTDGSFTIDSIKEATYLVQIYSLGKKHFDKEIFINKPIDLGTVIIEQDTQLEEIVVKTNKKVFERKADRTVFNIENSVHAINNDAVELLKLTPGLQVDNQSIKLIGKNELRVMINDKFVQLNGEELIQYLKSLPSNSIKKIEVITTPPAKYEAEGDSGLINIVLKENRANAWNNSISTGYKQGRKGTYRLSNVFSYNKGKVSIKSSFSTALGKSQINENATIYYPEKLWDGQSIRFDNNNNIAGNFQLDYQLNNKTSIGIQYMGNVYDPKSDDTDHITVNNYVDNSVQNIYTNAKNTGVNNSHAVNLHLTHNIDTLGTKLNSDLDYFNYTNDQTRLFNTKTEGVNNIGDKLLIASTTGNQNIENISAKVGIEQPLNWMNLSYGIKTSFVTTKNKNNFYDLTNGHAVEDIKQKDNFQYNENTQAIYASANKKINDKWTVQAGLRLENTQTKGYSVTYETESKKNYTKLFPTLYISHTLNDDNTFILNYNRRIRRPAFWELNPFQWYVSAYAIASGNPKLEPSYTNKVELSHTYKNKLTTTLTYSKADNMFSQYPTIDKELNRQIYLRDNIMNSTYYSLSVNYMYNRLPWLQSQLNVNAFYLENKLIKDVSINFKDGGAVFFSTNNTIYFNTEKSLSAQVDFTYESKVKANLWELDPSFKLGVGVKYSMLDNKLNMSIYADDIFRSYAKTVYTTTNDIRQKYKTDYDQRYINVGISYSFGNAKIKVKEHQGGNTDEKSRK